MLSNLRVSFYNTRAASKCAECFSILCIIIIKDIQYMSLLCIFLRDCSFLSVYQWSVWCILSGREFIRCYHLLLVNSLKRFVYINIYTICHLIKDLRVVFTPYLMCDIGPVMCLCYDCVIIYGVLQLFYPNLNIALRFPISHVCLSITD